MVIQDLNCVIGPFQDISPFLKASDDQQEFLVMDLVVPLGGINAFGGEAYWMPLSVVT